MQHATIVNYTVVISLVVLLSCALFRMPTLFSLKTLEVIRMRNHGHPWSMGVRINAFPGSVLSGCDGQTQT